MTHVTCRLTAKNRDHLRNPTFGNRVWATFFAVGGHFGIERSVHLSVPWRSCLGYRHAGCLQLCHQRPPEMCGLRTCPWMDVDPPRFLPLAGRLSSLRCKTFLHVALLCQLKFRQLLQSCGNKLYSKSPTNQSVAVTALQSTDVQQRCLNKLNCRQILLSTLSTCPGESPEFRTQVPEGSTLILEITRFPDLIVWDRWEKDFVPNANAVCRDVLMDRRLVTDTWLLLCWHSVTLVKLLSSFTLPDCRTDPSPAVWSSLMRQYAG